MLSKNPIGHALTIETRENYDLYVQTMILGGFTHIYTYSEMINKMIVWESVMIHNERYTKICLMTSAEFASKYRFLYVEHITDPTPFCRK